MGRLQIIKDESPRPRGRILTSRIKERGTELQARLDRQWLERGRDETAFEALRIERLLAFLTEHLELTGLSCVDLGCGTGELSAGLRSWGCDVLAVDLSSKALALLRERHGEDFPTRQDLIPHSNLEDDSFDLVVSTDVIAELDSREYPVYMSELYRLAKPNGWVFCSTAVDVYSSDALQRFVELVERDFVVKTWLSSHHRGLIQLRDGLKKIPGLRGLEARVVQWPRLIRRCEQLSTWLWSDAGISHVAFLGQRKRLGSSL